MVTFDFVYAYCLPPKVKAEIDKELDKLLYTTAEVKTVLDGKTLICKFTKSKPLIGFADAKEKNAVRVSQGWEKVTY